ncbi:MAG: hypothetical protein WC919_02445 [Candidatus Paceibacterota bacterium]|jgi:hypothetical protein|nr:hypothetical protein [Candidatus Paceibacterota bacterium]
MQKFSIILIFLLVIALAVVSVLYFNARSELSQEPEGVSEEEEETPSNFWELTDYPNNLIEGTVVSSDLEGSGTITISAEAYKIISDAGNLEKVIRVDEDTEFIFHEVTPESDRQMQPSEIQEGDFIVVATEESVREEIMTRTTFTATRITKIRVE